MLVHSMKAQHGTIGEVASKVNLCKAIKQAKKDLRVFKVSVDNVGEAGGPEELHSVISWMLKGYTLSK